MKLHRAGKQPEWSGVAPATHNLWQRTAVRTNGVITPGNALTLIGFALVCASAWFIVSDQLTAGFIFVAIGRFLDIADGWVAEKTKTKSPLGESLDAGLDKIAALVILISFAIAEIAPLWILGLLLLPHVLTAAISAVAYAKNRRIHPSSLGKVSTVIIWLSLICFIGNAIEPDAFIRAIAYVCAFASITFGLVASLRYMRTAKSAAPLA